MSTNERTVDRIHEDLGELVVRHEGGINARAFQGYADDPVGFIREVLGGEPWNRQVEIAEAVRDHAQVTVRSCNAAGKDWIAARLALWWCYARGGLAVLTGPTASQVEEILMRGEVRTAFTRGKLPGELHVRALRPKGEGRAGILARTSSGVSSLTGHHDARVLFVISEAQDEDRLSHAWDASFAVATGAEDRKLVLGNPLNPSGRFYRSHRPSSGWHSIKIAASDIPNVRKGERVVPGLLDWAGVDRIAEEYGSDSGFYRARVEAEFPEEAADALFRREWIEAAARRWSRRKDRDPGLDGSIPVAAIDPARHGPDASVLALRRGDVVREFIVWEGRHGTTDLAKEVEWALRDRGFRSDGSRSQLVRIIVDEVGVGGGVLDRLREDGWRARGFNAGRKPVEDERYFNRRAEAYWRLRNRLEDADLAVIWNDALVEDLLALRWRATPSGKVQLESKRDVAGRLGRSPDRADALAMVLYPWTEVGHSGSGGRMRSRLGVVSAG